jgi:hypothetical protein
MMNARAGKNAYIKCQCEEILCSKNSAGSMDQHMACMTGVQTAFSMPTRQT